MYFEFKVQSLLRQGQDESCFGLFKCTQKCTIIHRDKTCIYLTCMSTGRVVLRPIACMLVKNVNKVFCVRTVPNKKWVHFLVLQIVCIRKESKHACINTPQNMSLVPGRKKFILGWMNKVASANRNRRESIFKENVCLQRASISQHPPATPEQICVLCFVYANHFWIPSNFSWVQYTYIHFWKHSSSSTLFGAYMHVWYITFVTNKHCLTTIQKSIRDVDDNVSDKFVTKEKK